MEHAIDIDDVIIPEYLFAQPQEQQQMPIRQKHYVVRRAEYSPENAAEFCCASIGLFIIFVGAMACKLLQICLVAVMFLLAVVVRIALVLLAIPIAILAGLCYPFYYCATN